MTERNASWQISSASSRREIVPELENEPPRRRVMPVEQLVPRLRLTAAAAREQICFRVQTHAVMTLFQAPAFEQPDMDDAACSDGHQARQSVGRDASPRRPLPRRADVSAKRPYQTDELDAALRTFARG